MPSLVDNQLRWTGHPWQGEGHEWSPGGTAAGGEMLWWRGLLPRIHAHLPAGRVLEIGPGFGRWTEHLLGLSDRLIIVDLTERCIEHCRRKFAGDPRLECWANDGQSLDMVPDGSVDFVFSFDSLVHAEAPVLRAYLAQLARKLRPGGTGLIHHSNLQALAGADGRLPSWVTRTNWRAESMSARLFREYCAQAGLRCASQEIINWVSRSERADRHRVPGWGMPLSDAISVFTRPAGAVPQPTRVFINPRFVHEWRQLKVLADLYATGNVRADADSQGRSRADRGSGEAPTVARAARVLRQEGVAAVVGRIRQKVAAAASERAALAREFSVAREVRRSEPVLNRVRAGRCPDCDGVLSAGTRCTPCDVDYRF